MESLDNNGKRKNSFFDVNHRKQSDGSNSSTQMLRPIISKKYNSRRKNSFLDIHLRRHSVSSSTMSKRRKSRDSNGGMSFRTEIRQTFNDYASATTIHGISYLSNENRKIERFLWLVVVVAAMMFTLLQTTTLYTDWQNEPVIRTLDSIIPITDIEFPAVTICPEGTIDKALDAVLFKQLKEYIANRTFETSGRMKREAAENNDQAISDEILKDFLRDKYPGAKKKPTKLIKLMISEDPESTLKNEAVILPGLDEKNCGKNSTDDFIKAVENTLNDFGCPEGFRIFKNLFCIKLPSNQMDYFEAKEYCNGQYNSSLLGSEIDLNPVQDWIESFRQDGLINDEGKQRL